MNDWEIVKGIMSNKRLFLIHKKCNFSTAFKDKESYWRCIGCGEVTPKEVALFADLCYCYQMPKSMEVWYTLKSRK